MNLTSDTEYKGPGRWLGVFGGARMGALAGALTAAVLTVVFPGVGMMIPALIAFGGSLIGGYLGYEKAVEGERQFFQMHAKLDAAQMHLAEHDMQPQVAQSRFTDRIQPRTAHGNYADAVTADRANPAEQAR